jgi:flagellar assembly protein FliH
MPAKVLFPVPLAPAAPGTVVPLGSSPEDAQLAAAACATAAPSEREQLLAAALEELQQHWDERERAHLAELRAAEARGAAAVQQEVTAAAQHLTVLADALRAEHEEVFRAAEETVVRLAIAVARRIVGDAVQFDDTLVLATVRRALEHAAEAQRVVVHAHPGDLQLIEQHASTWAGLVPRARAVRFQADPRVGRGGCMLETETGQVIAAVEEQLRNLESALVARVR